MLLFLLFASMTLTIVMTLVAWRATTEARRRSDARVAALAAEIHGTALPAPDLALRPDVQCDVRPEPRAEVQPAVASIAYDGPQGMFATADTATAGSRYGLALAAGGFVVATIAAAAIAFGGGSSTTATRTAATPTDGRARGQEPAAALELVTLAHDRVGDTLTVRGAIRNPANGSEMDQLTAVVFVFDRDGGFVASGRAAVDAPALLPGGESTFVVTIPSLQEVGRYRVSFRSGDRIVSHIDVRNRS